MVGVKDMMCVMCVCVFDGIRTGQYDRIMRWWSINIGQGLLQT